MDEVQKLELHWNKGGVYLMRQRYKQLRPDLFQNQIPLKF